MQCAIEQEKLPRNSFGGKRVAREPGAGAGGDIWNQTQVRGAADRSHGRMNLDSIILLCDGFMLILNMSYQIVTLIRGHRHT